MRPTGYALLLLLDLVAGTQLGLYNNKVKNGFIGYGIDLFNPACAHACFNSIAYTTNCTNNMTRTEYAQPVLPISRLYYNFTHVDQKSSCNAEYEPFLQTLAWCMHKRCQNETTLALEQFWWNEGPGKDNSSVETYSQIWPRIKYQIKWPMFQNMTLDYTATVPMSQWEANYNNIIKLVKVEVNHETYALILFLTCAIIPILLSLLRFLPWPSWFLSRLHAHIIDPPLIGTRQCEPVGELFMMPTRGQAMYIAYIWSINIVLSGLGYHIAKGSQWYPNDSNQLMTHVANRLGTLAFANVPLLILFAGRNNILLWLTNWPRTTFLMMHRWIAVICTIETFAHSFMFFYAYSMNTYAMKLNVLVTMGYWQWGAVGTFGMIVLVFSAIQPLRRRAYDLFIVVHIVVSMLVLAGCYQHVVLRYGRQRGFETWVFVAMAIWGFDRFVRLVRSFRRGVKRAYITTIDADYMRVDIPGVSARGHVYLHFPTVSGWMFWESHPFSVAGSSCYNSYQFEYDFDMDKGDSTPIGYALSTPSYMAASLRKPPMIPRKTGVTLFIKKCKGLTGRLGALDTDGEQGIPVLMEGSYNEEVTFLQENHLQPTPSYQNIVCFAGGVGITGVLPFLDKFGGLTSHGSKKLFWGVRSMPLVHSVEDMLGAHTYAQGSERRWGDIDVSISFGRFSIYSALQEHLDQVSGGTIVVVCGPASMADQVRMVVTKMAKNPLRGKIPLKLVVESFTW